MRRLGLRSRLVGAILLTSAVTLAAVAITLLSPLERSLREDELDSLASSARDAAGAFGGVPPGAVAPGSPELRRAAIAAARRAEARIVVLDSSGTVLFNPSGSGPLIDTARAARAARRTVRAVVDDRGSQVAVAAVRTRIGDRSVVIALRRSLESVHSAVGVVQHAFVIACVIGLGLGLLLGVGLATTLLRRLRRLRDAVHRVGADGLETQIPTDASGDEVADLTRAFQAMQVALRRQEESRRAFVATASHELRTPITSLNGMLELLEEDLLRAAPDLADARVQLTGARRQSARLVALARDLLDLSRLDAGSELRREPIELSEICRAVLAEFEMRAGELGVELALEPAPEPCWALADPGSVARIVRILVDNALRYSPAGEAVRVEVGAPADGSAALLAVSDRGPGIALADAEIVFERFRRGADASPDDGGFGLGLAIGRELARQMGGELGLVAQTQGGARFELSLPSAAPERVADPPPELADRGAR